MAETTPHLAPIVVLLFLGAVFVTCVSLLVSLYGVVRRSKPYVRIGGGVALTVVAGYMLLLCGVSLASSEKVLPAGGWKYFCEIDCHIGYSVSGVHTTSVIGPEFRQESAHGQFVIVRLKVWFDEHTISPNRGEGRLTPKARSRVRSCDWQSGFFEAAVTSRPIFREVSCLRCAQRRLRAAPADHRG